MPIGPMKASVVCPKKAVMQLKYSWVTESEKKKGFEASWILAMIRSCTSEN